MLDHEVALLRRQVARPGLQLFTVETVLLRKLNAQLFIELDNQMVFVTAPSPGEVPIWSP